MTCNKDKIPKTSMLKFFPNETAEGLFHEINYDGTRMTFKGFINQLSATTKLVANARELNECNIKNIQALQRTHRFFSSIFQYIRYKNIDRCPYDSVRDKVVKKNLDRIERKHLSTTTPVEDTTDSGITDDDAPGTLLWGKSKENLLE